MSENVTVWCLRDRLDPGVYRIGIQRAADEPGEVTLVSWNEARVSMGRDGFFDVCRMSFADWCARNGYPEEGN